MVTRRIVRAGGAALGTLVALAAASPSSAAWQEALRAASKSQFERSCGPARPAAGADRGEESWDRETPSIQGAPAGWATRDCDLATFLPGQPAASRPTTLRSRIYVPECRWWYGQRVCRDRQAATVERNVSLDLKGPRRLKPWQREVFLVCLERDSVSVRILERVHEYGPARHHRGDPYRVEIPAYIVLPAEADPSGLAFEAWEQDRTTGRLRLVLRDRWAAHYAAGTTAVRVELKREVPGWLDKTVLKGEFRPEADAQGRLVIELAGALREALVTGSRYYAEWSFARRDEHSVPRIHSGGKTPRVEVQATSDAPIAADPPPAAAPPAPMGPRNQ